MAGPIQKAASNLVGTAAAITVAGKKLSEDEKQASAQEAAKAETEAKAAAAVQKEAQEASLEADLINLGADPESAKSFMAARSLGLDTKKFGMIRRNGKFVGSYSSIAEKLSKDSLTDSLSSRVINEKGFAERVVALGGTRKGRIDALVRASKGGQK
jgi:hypothetical protein